MEIKRTDIKSAITFRNEVILRPTGERQTRLAASLETCFDLKEIRFIGLNTFDISISKVYVLEKFYDRIWLFWIISPFRRESQLTRTVLVLCSLVKNSRIILIIFEHLGFKMFLKNSAFRNKLSDYHFWMIF